MTCVILAGGEGKRLSRRVSDVPKPLAPVAGRPFLEYLLRQLHRARLLDVVLCVCYKARMIEDYFGDGKRIGVRISYSRESVPLGTAGALAHAVAFIRSDPFLVMNGDSYCPVDLRAVLNYHKSHGALATVVATQVKESSRYGSIVLSAHDEVTSFCEKQSSCATGYVNAGIYVLSKALLELVPREKYCSIERDIFPLLAGKGLYGFRHSGEFLDIGTPASLQIAQEHLPELSGLNASK